MLECRCIAQLSPRWCVVGSCQPGGGGGVEAGQKAQPLTGRWSGDMRCSIAGPGSQTVRLQGMWKMSACQTMAPCLDQRDGWRLWEGPESIPQQVHSVGIHLEEANRLMWRLFFPLLLLGSGRLVGLHLCLLLYSTSSNLSNSVVDSANICGFLIVCLCWEMGRAAQRWLRARPSVK